MARLGKKDNEQIIKELLIENKILEKENERLRTRCEQARDEGTGYMQQLEQENSTLKKQLEAQIEKMKQELDTAREEANRQEQWELYSVLNGIYNDNFEVITSVSN